MPDLEKWLLKCLIVLFKPFLTWNQHFWSDTLREITIVLFSKWNQHPSCHALTWNQHFNLFRPEINVVELIRCVKWPFCCFLSEIILAIMRWREINIFTYLDLKSTSLSLCAARNWHFAGFQVKSTSLPSRVNLRSTF